MSSFQVFALTVDNIQDEVCANAIKKKIYDVLHLSLEDFANKDNLSKDDFDDINSKIKVYINKDENSIFYLQVPLALTATYGSHVLLFDSIKETLLNLGYDIANIDEILDTKGIQQKVLEKIQNPFLDKYKISQNHDNIFNERTYSSNSSGIVNHDDIVVDNITDDEEYEVKATINGITCSACTSTINSMCKELWYVISSDVDFITKIGIFKLKSNNSEIINDLKQNIEECGYEFDLIEDPVLLSHGNTVPESSNYMLACAIEGIYCAACVHTISTAIKGSEQLKKYIVNYQINPITKIGNFVLSDYNEDIKILLADTIEDCGYDFVIIGDVKRSSSSNNLTNSNNKSRTINIKIENIYCDNCTTKIESLLQQKYLDLDEKLTFQWETSNFKDPNKNFKILKLTYSPSVMDDLQLRTILSIINSLDKLTASIMEKENLQDHMNRIASKELKAIALRLSATFLFAIPSFVFGIVIMSLLPESNKVKLIMEKKVLGNSTVLMWVLFGISTPVYLIIDFVFHKKSFNELRVLWKVNILFNRNVSKNKSLLARFNWRIFLKRFVMFGSMNLLISLGTSVAYFASVAMLILSAKQNPGEQMYDTYFDSITFLTFFLLIGKFLENYSKKKAIGILNNLAVSTGDSSVTIIDQLKSTESTIKYLQISKNQLELNDIMLIKPGESPVVDGVLLKPLSTGSDYEEEAVISQFDESSLTGESLPCNKIVNDQIYAGTINLTAPIFSQIVNLDNLSKGSLLDKIVESITIGQLNKRASLEKTADKLTSFFVPVICFISLIVWFIWLGLGYSGKLPNGYLCDNDAETCTMSWSLFSISFSISVFVISCPCALGLAVPLSIFVGSGILAKHSILPKGGGMALQNCSNVDIVCFDKTGTLTKGEVTVVDEFIIGGYNNMSWDLLLTLEKMSNHPLSFAVVNYVTENKKVNTESKASEVLGTVKEVSGKGLISSNGYIAGNEKFLQENNYRFDDKTKETLLKWQMKGYSIINFGQAGEIVLCLALADTIRIEAMSVIENLQSRNIEVYLLSGDNPITTKAIGKQLKINDSDKHVKGGLLPEDKSNIVKQVTENGKKTVLMVGDGINDAPALSNADVGVAISSMTPSTKEKMSSKTSDLALISCDFAILQTSYPLLSILTLLDISKITLHRVYMNLGWALVYNVIGIPIASGILYEPLRFKLSPTWSAFAMAASSVSVVLSSTLLKFYKPKSYKKKFGLNE